MVAYAVTHTHRLMLMIYGVETRREKEAKWKRGHHEQIHSFYWLKWFDRHFEILFCRIIAYLGAAIVFNVQCQLPNGQESSTFIEEKKAKQAICHKLKFNNNNRYTISRAHSFIYTTAAVAVAEAATAQNLTQRRFKAKSIKKSASITISTD